MIKKGTKLYSVLYNKCPRCHEGSFFTGSNPYNLRTFSKMEPRCGHCQESYNPEPGFYYGAMFVSYVFGIIWFVVVWLFSLYLLPEDLNFGWVVLLMAVVNTILMPVTFRISRLVWINIIVNYKTAEEIAQMKKEKLELRAQKMS